jgi:hypothetical protein
MADFLFGFLPIACWRSGEVIGRLLKPTVQLVLRKADRHLDDLSLGRGGVVAGDFVVVYATVTISSISAALSVER